MTLTFRQTRKIKPNYRSVTGKLAYKGDMIPYESTLERDFLIYFTSLRQVVDIVPQPITLDFKKNGRTHEYTPDYFVQFSCHNCTQKSLLIEVKPETEWRENWREWSDKWKVAQQYAKNNGFLFHIYDESRIRHQALYNLNILNSYKRLYVDRTVIKKLLDEIDNREITTVETILELYFKAGDIRKQGHRILLYMMSQQLIDFDIWTDDIKDEQLILWACDNDRYRFRPVY